MKKVQDLSVTPGQKLVFYDVKSLFTIIPVTVAIQCIKTNLAADNTLSSRCQLSLTQIIQLLEFILNGTNFVYKGVFYQQIFGCAMGLPVENFEHKALTTYVRPPDIWFRYVDDTFGKLHEYDVEDFTTHLNSVDPHIQFTSEPQKEEKLAFLDTCVCIHNNSSTKINVFRKHTHTDQYLNFHFNHHFQHKRSVVKTLFHRADILIISPEDHAQEISHLKEVLQDNDYQP